MAEAYRASRVHLHPGATGDTYGFTLAETQETGLPVVLGAVNSPLCDRFIDHETGIAAGSDDSFVKSAVTLLTNHEEFQRMSGNARLLKRGRTWAVAAAEWEDRLA
jgi:glycosyltransferase involved in cell wall biosynthesis